MKKSELKTGMYVEFSNMEKNIVLKNTSVGDVLCDYNLLNTSRENTFKRLWNHFSLRHFNEDLTSCNSVTGDIIKVYSTYGRLLWERKEEKAFNNLNELADFMQEQIDILKEKTKNL